MTKSFYITDREKEFLDAIAKFGSQVIAAQKLKVSVGSIKKAVSRVKKRKALIGDWDKNEDKFLIIPDMQTKAGVDFRYVQCIGDYWLDKKPGTVVCLGDFADMPSLSSYDKGKRGYEGRRYKTDIEAAKTAMAILMKPLNDFNKNQRDRHLPEYNPKMYMLMGNHEYRIERTTEIDAMLYGTISTDDLEYKKHGWIEIPFLQVKVLSGIAFSHYFTTGLRGMPCSTAQQQLNKMHMSCIAGHQQGRQAASGKRADGKRLTAIIAGSAYTHDESYLGQQGNYHWRGVIMLHNIEDGEFDEVYVPVSYLLNKYRSGDEPLMYCPD